MLLNGAQLFPDVSGALYWPAERVLVVADMHLEKGSAIAGRTGQLLPPFDSRATLTRLRALVRRHEPKVVICLGDAFHDPRAAQRLGAEEAALIRSLAEGRDWIWITGNHDPEPPSHLGGRGQAELRLGPLVFRHEALPDPQRGEVSGHYHPKASVTVAGQRLSQPCFVTDQRRLVLPAFGTYTGGLDVQSPALRRLFQRDFRVFLLGRDRLHSLPSARLDKPRQDARPGAGRMDPDGRGPEEGSGTPVRTGASVRDLFDGENAGLSARRR